LRSYSHFLNPLYFKLAKTCKIFELNLRIFSCTLIYPSFLMLKNDQHEYFNNCFKWISCSQSMGYSRMDGVCGLETLFLSILVAWPVNNSGYTSRNWPKCNHSIYDYMWLLVICNYIWTFLQLFLVLVIFATTLQLVCNHFGVHPSMWTTFSLVFIQAEQFISH
jgi:hypothetical protein